MLSTPHDWVDLRLDMIFNIVSGWTGWRLKLHFLFLIRFITSVSGLPRLFLRFFRRFLTLVMKNSFIILTKSLGLEQMLPFSISLVGGPPFDQPSQFLIFFQVVLESFPNSFNLSCCQSGFSVLRVDVTLFLRALYLSQSSLLLV